MKISPRNVRKAKVKAIHPRALNTEVPLELAPGLEITAVVTKHSAETLGLEIGREAYAVIKATSVMLGVD